MKKVATTATKVPVTTRALIQRINRKLSSEMMQLKTTRGERWRNDLGDYYIIDVNKNIVVRAHLDLEELSRELGCLSPWEKLEG
jgi:hypothetical protein